MAYAEIDEMATKTYTEGHPLAGNEAGLTGSQTRKLEALISMRRQMDEHLLNLRECMLRQDGEVPRKPDVLQHGWREGIIAELGRRLDGAYRAAGHEMHIGEAAAEEDARRQWALSQPVGLSQEEADEVLKAMEKLGKEQPGVAQRVYFPVMGPKMVFAAKKKKRR